MSQTSGTASPQPSLLKNLLRGTALYSVVLFAQRFASLALLPINTHYLTPADYGILDLLEQTGTVLSILLGLNIASALGYFYFAEETPEGRRKVASTVVIGAILIGILAAVSGLLLAEPVSKLAFNSGNYRNYISLLFLSMPFMALLEALFGWLRVTDRPGVYVTVSLGRTTLTLLLTILMLAILKLRVSGVLFSSLIAISIPALALFVYFLRQGPLSLDLKLFARIFRFSFPIGLSWAGMFIVNFGDRFFLNHYTNLSDVGVYAVAYKIGMLITFVHNAFHTYWSSQVYAVVKRDDAKSVIARIFTYMMLVLSFSVVLLCAITRPGLSILVTRPGFESAADLVPIILMAYFLRAIGDFFRCFLLVQGKPSHDAICTWIGAAFCLAAYYTLIPRFGMWGAAIATLGTFAAIAVISTLWAYRIYPFEVETVRLTKIALALAGALALYLTVKIESLPLQILWGILLSVLFPVSLLLLRFQDPGEIGKIQTMAMQTLQSMRKKLTPGT